MGLIARQIEAAGIPTVSMSSAFSITRAVNPPRALYLDFPLGHTAGKALDRELQLEIVGAALDAFEKHREPGQITELPFEWAEDDSWKDSVMRPREDGEGQGGHGDDRVERYDTPQYQLERDREMAEEALASGGCWGCVWV